MGRKDELMLRTKILHFIGYTLITFPLITIVLSLQYDQMYPKKGSCNYKTRCPLTSTYV